MGHDDPVEVAATEVLPKLVGVFTAGSDATKRDHRLERGVQGRVGFEHPLHPLCMRGVPDEHAPLGRCDRASDAAGGPAAEHDSSEEKRPQHDRLGGDHRVLHVRLDDCVDEREKRRDVEELGRVVEGRLVDDELVAVIQADCLRREDDQRQADQRPDVDEIRLEQSSADNDRDGGRYQVGSGEQPAKDRVSLRGGARGRCFRDATRFRDTT
jgi:hypothetical protein